jgi:hypothetical protein
VDRQLRLELSDKDEQAPTVALSAELQEQLIALMASAIAAVLGDDGGDDE